MIGVVTDRKKDQLFSIVEVFVIVVLALVPLFFTFPYRVNIYLSWEGAYRLSQGQIPFKDFGMPLGYMYWVIPAIFFKVFGPALITLVKAQVLINIISGFAFRSILKQLGLHAGVRLLCVVLYCVSFSFFNFWPWYNHTVIVYEMVGIAFLMRYLFSNKKKWIWISLSALFVFFSFFTKQDGGALAFILCLVLLVCDCIIERRWAPVVIYLITTSAVAFAIVAPLTRYNFNYWFNRGQPPHTSRISLFDIFDDFFYSSQWIKFYLLIIVALVLASHKHIKEFVKDKRNFIFFLLTMGILAEAAILQVTSYTPPDNNIFFHSFAFAFIFSGFVKYFHLNLYKIKVLLTLCFLLLLWWSGVFWKYMQGPFQNAFVKTDKNSAPAENVVNLHTYMLYPPAGEIPLDQWTFSSLKSFKKILLPRPTVDGMGRLLSMPMLKNKKDLHVLNMTELTPLAVEMPYQLETGSEIPLWFHLGVGMFNKQAEMYEKKIVNDQFDLVLFEFIPSLNNFFPFRIRDTLLHQYNKIDSFPAPRRGPTQGTIEVFVKKPANSN